MTELLQRVFSSPEVINCLLVIFKLAIWSTIISVILWVIAIILGIFTAGTNSNFGVFLFFITGIVSGFTTFIAKITVTISVIVIIICFLYPYLT